MYSASCSRQPASLPIQTGRGRAHLEVRDIRCRSRAVGCTPATENDSTRGETVLISAWNTSDLRPGFSASQLIVRNRLADVHGSMKRVGLTLNVPTSYESGSGEKIPVGLVCTDGACQTSQRNGFLVTATDETSAAVGSITVAGGGDGAWDAESHVALVTPRWSRQVAEPGLSAVFFPPRQPARLGPPGVRLGAHAEEAPEREPLAVSLRPGRGVRHGHLLGDGGGEL